MKVYISVDVEGVAGITDWDEAMIGRPGYETFSDQMTAEVICAQRVHHDEGHVRSDERPLCFFGTATENRSERYTDQEPEKRSG